jgi:hypothetical protein
MMRWHRDGEVVRLALVRDTATGTELLRVGTSGGAPVVESALVNEILVESPMSISAGVPRFDLDQNVPNPFNPSTVLRFSVPEAQHVRLTVYDVTGALVRTLVDRPMGAGLHEIVWDGHDGNGREVASGVFVCRLTAKQGVVTRKMVLAR